MYKLDSPQLDTRDTLALALRKNSSNMLVKGWATHVGSSQKSQKLPEWRRTEDGFKHCFIWHIYGTITKIYE